MGENQQVTTMAKRTGEVWSRKNSNLLLWVDRATRWGLTLIFLFAAIPKLFHPQQFGEVVAVYGLLPDFLVLPVAVVLPLVEVVLAIGLILKNRVCYYCTALLLLLFICLLSYGIWIGLDVDCGCFGPDDPESEAYHGLRPALIRDLLMLGFLLYSIIFQKFPVKRLQENRGNNY